MFFRQKRSGNRVYLQIVENQWVNGRSQQRVIATVGRLDELQQSGQLEGLLESGAKFAEAALVLTAPPGGPNTFGLSPPDRAGSDLRPALERTAASPRHRAVVGWATI